MCVCMFDFDFVIWTFGFLSSCYSSLCFDFIRNVSFFHSLMIQMNHNYNALDLILSLFQWALVFFLVVFSFEMSCSQFHPFTSMSKHIYTYHHYANIVVIQFKTQRINKLFYKLCAWLFFTTMVFANNDWCCQTYYWIDWQFIVNDCYAPAIEKMIYSSWHFDLSWFKNDLIKNCLLSIFLVVVVVVIACSLEMLETLTALTRSIIHCYVLFQFKSHSQSDFNELK